MLFIHTWEQVINGSKTATRRVIKPNYHYWRYDPFKDNFSRIVDCNTNRMIYAVGQRVAVMPARGVVGVRKVADFEIATLWRQDVREISEADAVKEGFANKRDFLKVWCDMHDPRSIEAAWMWDVQRGWLCLLDTLALRSSDRYMAAVIEWQPESLVVYADAAATARALLAKAG